MGKKKGEKAINSLKNNSPVSKSKGKAPNSAPGTTNSCSVKLYSETYHRGANVTLTKNTPNLAKLRFNNKLVSLEVTGTSCCWKLFTKPDYKGKRKSFYSHQMYTSTTHMGKLFRKAKSAKLC